MASLQKTASSPFWKGSIRIDGKWVLRSTGKLDKKEAQAVLDSWNEAAVQVLESPQQARLVMEEILAKYLGKDLGRITLSAYVEQWLKGKKSTVAASTYEYLESSLNCWIKRMGAAAEKDIRALTKEQIVNWRNAEAKRLRAKTVNHRLKAIRTLLASAVKEGYLTSNLAKDAGSVRAAQGDGTQETRRPFTFPELIQLNEVMDEEWRTITWLGFYTGQRLGDILRLRWNQFDEKSRSLRLTAQKTGKDMWLPLLPDMEERLTQWKAHSATGSPFLFPARVAELKETGGKVGRASNRFAHFLWLAGLRKHSPYGRSRAKERAAKERKAQGVPKESNRREQQELSFHSLRHTARTVLEEQGIPRAVIDAYVGHDGSTGKTYTHVGQDALRKAGAALALARNPAAAEAPAKAARSAPTA